MAELRLLHALYLKNGEVEKALECMEKVVALRPDDAGALEDLAKTAFVVEKYDRAKGALEKLNTSLPNNIITLRGLAVCYRAEGNAGKAEELNGQALGLMPEDGSAHIEAAEYFEQFGLMEAVYAEYGKAIEIPAQLERFDDTHYTGMMRTAFYLRDEGRYAGAAKMYSRLSTELEQEGIQTAVSINHTAGAVRCSIKDSGKGAPEALREKIFQPFFTTREGGSGLGLAICGRIIEEYGGKIDFESDATGSTFWFELPGREA